MTTVESNLKEFNAAFARYVEVWTARGHGILDDALEKKGRDIGIRLWKGFTAHKWGGAGKPPSNLARSELDDRAAEGRGIKVRASLRDEYLAARTELRNATRGKKTAGVIKKKIALWQSFVGRELALRQRGIGVLAASFLWFRKRGRGNGVYLVPNRRGRAIGAVERGPTFFRIIADVAGQSVVDSRYAIVESVLAGATEDIESYLKTREREHFRAVFANLVNAA